MNAGSKTVFAREVKKLVDLKLFDSAQTLCTLFASQLCAPPPLSSVQAGESVSSSLAEVYEMLADCLLERGEVKRALQTFRQATQQRKSTLGCKYRHQSPISSAEDALLRLKECRCLVLLQDTSALRELEGVPAKFRDTQTHLLLGELYQAGGRRRNAAASYREVLLAAPTALEVVEKLVDLGVEAADILSTLDEAFRYREEGAQGGLSQGWLHSLVAALAHKRSCDHDRSQAHMQKLTAAYPQNAYLLTHMAQLAQECGQAASARSLYSQVRALEPLQVGGMASYGLLLLQEGDSAELSRLTSAVLDCADKDPTGWLLAAMYSSLQGEGESALQLVDKAVRLSPSSSQTYKLKGQLLCTQGSHSQALIAYSQANSLLRDLPSYAGLLRSSLALGRSKEAAGTARQCLAALPRSAQAHVLMGGVFAQAGADSAE
ncbi:hypothetical protein B484DRAFT_402523, partial [Ochromonadaceae sp. CCMP2298]